VFDPLEGVTADGLIRTGANLARVPELFLPVLDAARDEVAGNSGASLYMYGSVATGQARVGESDVDLLTIGLTGTEATAVSANLSSRFASICRSVEVATSSPEDFVGDSDEAYGGRVFLHHYCVHLAGVDHDHAVVGFPADARAARGFNGDIAVSLRRWRDALDHERPAVLGRAIARKSLLAVAGLVSVHDRTWTTDRERAAIRWSEIDPDLRAGLRELMGWSDCSVDFGRADVARMLRATVEPIVDAFAHAIGLWIDAENRSGSAAPDVP
jgi:hypothetical protein